MAWRQLTHWPIADADISRWYRQRALGLHSAFMSTEHWWSRLDRVMALTERLLRDVTGAGPDARSFDSHDAFRWDAERGPGRLVPVEGAVGSDLADLIGVDSAVAKLVSNTEQFVRGLPSNNVLLHGERGTGKSSAVKGLLHRYAPSGLRLVEVQREALIHLPRILAAIRRDGGRHRFLVFCDDLSFGAGEGGFRELKAALEGGLEAPPENVRIVATSNRRHLLPEVMTDNRKARLDDDNELHLGEALEERLALSDRFGLVIGFYSFDQRTYLGIVAAYLRKAGFRPDAEGSAGELQDGLPRAVRVEALRWTVVRASRSGRSARQFVDDYLGRQALASLGSEAPKSRA
jgi:predicted AAA+ superfamily ATPase